MSGRFAPSPTGDLHLGSLRTAIAAWLAARSTERGFVIRAEDLDPAVASGEFERSQIRDLAEIGIVSDVPIVRQSERFEIYRAVIEDLRRRDLVYECYCTRAEIHAAASAPHDPPPSRADGVIDLQPEGTYPGTCRDLGRRSSSAAPARPAALRLRSERVAVTITDVVAGPVRAVVDDLVLQRADGTPAYNLAVVVDDARQGVTQVVRGDDLLASTPRQVMLQRLLGFPTPEYLHVPLVLGDDGRRLAKRHGAVTLAELHDAGHRTATVVTALLHSLGFAEHVVGLDDALDAIECGEYTWTKRDAVSITTLGL